MSIKHRALADYIAGQIEEVSVQEDLDHPHAWSRVVGHMLGYDPEQLNFVDGNDGGVDFYANSGSIYEVYQCKMHNMDDAGALDIDTPYDIEGIQDLQRAFGILLDGAAPRRLDARILSLRAQLREEMELLPETSNDSDAPNQLSVVFHLATLGDNITPAARTEIENFKKRLRTYASQHPGLSLNLERTGLDELAQFFEDPERSPEGADAPIQLGIGFEPLSLKNPNEAVVRTNDFVTFYARATDLVTAALKVGPALFDANVRYELKRSNVNEEIRQSATHTKTIKFFHLYNNGVTIAANGWAFKSKGQSVEIRNPSVINGCQTVRSLIAARKQLEEDAATDRFPLDAFNDRCLVLVRLIHKNTMNIEDVVRAANTQNPMEPRNLLGNRPEQRALEWEFST